MLSISECRFLLKKRKITDFILILLLLSKKFSIVYFCFRIKIDKYFKLKEYKYNLKNSVFLSY